MAFPTNDPDWATEDTYLNGDPNKIRPDQSLQDYGYLPDAEPTSQELNWQLNNLAEQIKELKQLSVDGFQTPVNELKLIAGDNRNPAVIYGYGVWSPYAQGRTLVGAGTATDGNLTTRTFSAGSVGGTFEEFISESQMPSHNHEYRDRYYVENSGRLASATDKEFRGNVNGGLGPKADGDFDNNTFLYLDEQTESSGGDQAVNNLPPYVTLYIWRRTS